MERKGTRRLMGGVAFLAALFITNAGYAQVYSSSGDPWLWLFNKDYSFSTAEGYSYPLEPDGLADYLNEHPNPEVKRAMWDDYNSIAGAQTTGNILVFLSVVGGIGTVAYGVNNLFSDSVAHDDKPAKAFAPFFGGFFGMFIMIAIAQKAIKPDMGDYQRFFRKHKRIFPEANIEIYRGAPDMSRRRPKPSGNEGVIQIRWSYSL